MLAWIDLEMTGLEPSKHVIVEIATIITDDDLNIIEEGPGLVIMATADELGEMEEFVSNMHTRSGLLQEIEQSQITLEQAQAQTMAFLKKHIKEARSVPLCGNSIGTDRRFLAQWMPQVEDYLHYRCVDVSTIKELAKRWLPAIAKGVPQKASGHRALDDIRESIAELKYFRETIFMHADDTPNKDI